MPAHQPFTLLCQAAIRPLTTGRADLHLHTTCSDGSYTPAEVVDLARRSGLAAIAITDHDTLAGVPLAQRAALGSGVEIIPGVEITAEHAGHELHLLGYFVALDNKPLGEALADLRQHRVGRFWDMAERLRQRGVSIDEGELRRQLDHGVLSRRHLAQFLVNTRQAGSLREAFQRYLGDGSQVVVPKRRLGVAGALELVRGAGGVASWAHPSSQCTRAALLELQGLGLHAIEAGYPSFRNSRAKQLRGLAGELGLATTAGSDCHGPGREIGSCSVTADELERLRRLAATE